MNAYQSMSAICVSLMFVNLALVGGEAIATNRTVELLFASPDSTGSVAIGMAEGTRTVDGGKTSIWDAHTDPGNRKRNQGTFSNQIDGSNPEEADKLQLERVRKFANKLAWANPDLTELELVGGADLYNQAPKAAAVYLDKLEEAKEKGLSGLEAIVEARTNSYITPEGKLDAPGLRNSVDFVRHDQNRRMSEIEKALKNR
ncbi:MAG TPA: hypothetical protein IGS17_16340 [Oscillatoriales cyanobacterium M59_W2019_021]|nr:MAG: hypothetical protein D6728_18310 [Cyanobacteria bacterium J055]HIK32735.1 hypothetical protein [Oscillatoriales cyanobacterium M4454_W2019_049]HIK52474.1 hypothetical protein [Oscillatoriales cyanobacterium M59_W2019_021]